MALHIKVDRRRVPRTWYSEVSTLLLRDRFIRRFIVVCIVIYFLLELILFGKLSFRDWLVSSFLRGGL